MDAKEIYTEWQKATNLPDYLKDQLNTLGKINNSIAVTGIFAAWQVLNGHGQARDVTAPFDLRPTSIATRRSGPDLKKQ